MGRGVNLSKKGRFFLKNDLYVLSYISKTKSALEKMIRYSERREKGLSEQFHPFFQQTSSYACKFHLKIGNLQLFPFFYTETRGRRPKAWGVWDYIFKRIDTGRWLKALGVVKVTYGSMAEGLRSEGWSIFYFFHTFMRTQGDDGRRPEECEMIFSKG